MRVDNLFSFFWPGSPPRLEEAGKHAGSGEEAAGVSSIKHLLVQMGGSDNTTFVLASVFQCEIYMGAIC